MQNELFIENFKCFKELNIPISGLTVLAGANGVGKSTVIQSFLLIRQTLDVLYSHEMALISKVHPPSATEMIGQNVPTIPYNILLNGPYLLSLGTSKEVIHTSGGSNSITFGCKNRDSFLEFNYDIGKSNLSILLRDYSGDIKNNDIFITNKSFYYLNAERLGPRNIQDLTVQDFINTGWQGEYTGYAISQVEENNLGMNIDDPRAIKGRDNSYKEQYILKKQIECWLDFILPGIEISVEPFLRINATRVSLRRKASETEFLHPNNIGFGITYVLPIIVSGLIAEKGSMFIVENPEAHLHPQGQSRIGEFLWKVAEAGIQVIVETHSEHVINGIRRAFLKSEVPNTLGSIIFFSQSPKSLNPSIEKIDITAEGDLTNWPSGFFDQEQRDFAELTRIRREKKSAS